MRATNSSQQLLSFHRNDSSAQCNLNGICEQTYYRNPQKLCEGLCKNLPFLIDALEKPFAVKKQSVMSPLPDTKTAGLIGLPNATIEINEGAMTADSAFSSPCTAEHMLIELLQKISI